MVWKGEYERKKYEDKGEIVCLLSQDNNSTEEAAEHSQANWEKMLAGLKQVVEGS
jgi:hypothetical protein